MPEYARTRGGMREYTQFYLSGFCFTFRHYNPMSKRTIGCFLKQTKLDFF